MHKWAQEILKTVKSNVESIGIGNFEGKNLDDLKDWTEIAKNIACFDKDFKIVEAMEKSESTEESMEMISRYENYPSKSKSRGYQEPPYWHMTPDMYYDWLDMPEEERMRDLDRLRYGRMYYSEPRKGANKPFDAKGIEDNVQKYESRYDRARRSYTETKELHRGNTKEDTDANMHGLESFLTIIDEDLKDIMPGLSASEKAMLKAKITSWGQRI